MTEAQKVGASKGDSSLAKLKELAEFVGATIGLITLLKSLGLPGGFADSWLSVVLAAMGMALLAVLALRTWRRSKKPGSRLGVPVGLRLSAGDHTHLVGRQDEIVQLVECCRSHSLVFLDGASGVGKSALVAAGVVPALRNDPQLLPVLISNWGRRDWLSGALTATHEALLRDLPENCRNLVRDFDRTSAQGLADLLHEAARLTGRTPMLILDQFDDYQIAFREAFLPPSTCTWTTPEELISRNPYWHELSRALQRGVAHLLVVTRSDMSAGLSSIRLGDTRNMTLLGLPRADIAALIRNLGANKIEGNPVVVDPELGWNHLADVIARDLAKGQALVLPQRLTTLLASLQELETLDEAQYLAAGRCDGLLARFIEAEVLAAAEVSGLEPALLRSLLLMLVDESSRDKTTPRAEAEIREHVSKHDKGGTEARIAGLQRAAERLELRQILRRRVDPESGLPLWQLDHDYLCHGVLGCVARANRWQHELDEAWERFRHRSAGWRAAWDALLAPGVWFKTLWSRARHRLVFGASLQLVAWSALRLLPHLLVVVILVIAVMFWVQWRQSDAIWKRLEFVGNISSDEIAALDELRDASWLTRRTFTDQMLQTPSLAGRMLSEPMPVLHALVNLQRDRGTALKALALDHLRTEARTAEAKDARLTAAAMTVIAALDDQDLDTEDSRLFLCEAARLDQAERRGRLAKNSSHIIARGVAKRVDAAIVGHVCANGAALSALTVIAAAVRRASLASASTGRSKVVQRKRLPRRFHDLSGDGQAREGQASARSACVQPGWVSASDR
ncbi:hypothetical protein PEC18_05575 [Paucibacter sp. O1-1]|nr:hypothetical protein [Paucibacter sp. O1-1]MDA3825340.1 hypothetical protein [Paucibacter sp. O1-1]